MRIAERIERRGIALLVLLALGSLFWKSPRVTLGVLMGGCIAVADFRLLRTLFSSLMLKGKGGIILVLQLVKYLFLASLLGALFFFKIINPLATLTGLSILGLMPLLALIPPKREIKEAA